MCLKGLCVSRAKRDIFSNLVARLFIFSSGRLSRACDPERSCGNPKRLFRKTPSPDVVKLVHCKGGGGRRRSSRLHTPLLFINFVFFFLAYQRFEADYEKKRKKNEQTWRLDDTTSAPSKDNRDATTWMILWLTNRSNSEAKGFFLFGSRATSWFGGKRRRGREDEGGGGFPSLKAAKRFQSRKASTQVHVPMLGRGTAKFHQP